MSPPPYLAVADAFAVPVGEVRLIAAHAWNVSGALEAGCRGCLPEQARDVASPIGPQPDLVAGTLTNLAGRIIEQLPLRDSGLQGGAGPLTGVSEVA